MLKNLKKAAAIVLSFAMAVQFGLADSYYVNAVEEPVEPQQEETKTTTTAPQEQEQEQEQEEVPTTEEETPQQQQEEGQQQPAVEEEQPAAEEAQPQPQPVEQAEVKVSYVKEDDTDLMESVTATYDVGYRLDQDTNVFKEAHEAFEFEYAFVNGNKENKITKDQVKASGLTVTSDMTSLTLVYKSTATQKDSKDKKVETANLSGEKEDDSDSEDDIATVANNSIELKVGEKATLDSSDVEDWGYNHQHKWTVNKKNIVNLSSKSGSSITVTGEGVGTATVTDTYTYSSFMGGSKRGTKTYTINVTAAVTPTGISISGADTVKQFQTTQLTANLTPEGANGKVTWTSSNEQILSVDENGLVTGNRQGLATITASVQGADKNTLSATKTIEVVKNESPSSGNKREALVYYLKDPTKDANSNGQDQWGPSSLGTAIVNVEGATWTGNKNCFDNVDQRVLSWPTDLNGTNVVPRSNNAWNLIFDAYKASIEKELKVTITKDDVEEITLVPAKISKDNGTTPDMHLDCNVNIKCKSVALVKYWLFDANGTNWDMLGSKNYVIKDGSTTKPSDVTDKDFPKTKTVNGVTYTFSGWYTDQSLTKPAPSFPAKVTGAVNYYAKYVAGYQVKYNLAGGQFSDGSTSATEKHNVDTTVVVKEAPTRKGYKFTGWTVEGLDGTTINSGDSFTMPNGNVTLTANWEKKDINDYVTLKTKDVTETYNGQSHAAGEATAVAKAGKENEIGKLTVEYQKADGKWTTNREEITAKDVSDSKTVNVRVSSDDCLEYVTGTEKITINPATLTVKTEGAKRAYNGKPLTAEGTITGFVNGETAKFTVTGSQTTVGQSTNTYNIDWKAKDTTAKKGNYTISEDLGDLVVTQFAEKITVTTTGGKFTYDGNAHGATVAVTGLPAGYTVETATSDATATDVTEKAVKAECDHLVIKDDQGKDVTSELNVDYKAGTIQINPATLTVKTEGAKRAYNGKPLTAEGTITGFVNGETAKFTVTGSQTTVGQSTNTYNIDWKAKDTTAKKGNYTISEDLGDLVVTQFAEKITVTTTGGKFTYDGNAHGATVAVTGLPAGYTVETATSDATATDVTEKAVKAECDHLVIKDDQGKDVTSELNVDYKAGTIQINPATLTVKTEGAKRAYNGKPLTAEGTITGFVNGETAKFTVTGSQTTVGQSTNTYNIDWKAKDTTAKKGNYTISEDLGDLVVTQFAEKITVTTTGGKFTYDGNAHGATVAVTGLPAGYTVETATSDATATDVTEKAVKAECDHLVIKDDQGKDVTSELNVDYKAGTIQINPATLTVKTEGAKRAYNGKPLTAEGTITGFVNGETAKFTVTGSQTTVGQSTNTYNIDWKAKDTTAKKGNYTISEDLGDLVVISKSIVPDDKNTPEEKKTGIKVTAPKDTTYSGNEQKREPVIEDTKTGKTLDKDDYSLSYSDDVTNAGTVTITVTGKGNYTGKFEVTYKINPRKVTLKSETASKPYDGTALTKPAVKVSGDGFVEGEVSDIKATGSVTTVSEGEVTNTITFTKENNYKDGNYKIEKDEGKLSITAQSIDPGTDPEKPNPDYTGAKVNSPSDEVYDGNEHKWIPTVTDKADKKLKAGTDYTVEYSTKNFKDVGTIDVTITGKGNYTGTVTRTYKITPKSVTVTAEDKTKLFGETDPKLTAKVAGTLGNDTVEYTLSRETGEAAGKYEITVKGDKLQGNYKVTCVAGTLTITSQSIDPGTDPEKPNPDYTGAKVNSPKDSVYDGKEHKWIPTVTDKADKKLEAGKDYTVEYSTKNFKDVGTIKVTITGIGNYSGTVKRSYKVTPKEYTVTTDSATKTYSGTALTAGGKVEGIVSGETVEFTTTGSQTEVGTSKNTYELVWKSAKKSNYKLAKESIGELTVTAQSIDPGTDPEKPNPDYTGAKVNSPSDKVYDGNEHKWSPTVTDKADKKLEAGKDYTVEYSTSDFTNVGTIEVVIKGKGNYTGTVKRSYKVTPKEYTVTTESATKTYSSTALTAGGKVEGIVSGETVEFTTTGSQTEVGTSKNTYELVWKSAKATNYTLAKESIGKLTVKAKSIIPDGPDTPDEKKTGITVSEPSDSKYDGKKHKEVLTVTDTKTGKELVAGTDPQ